MSFFQRRRRPDPISESLQPAFAGGVAENAAAVSDATVLASEPAPAASASASAGAPRRGWSPPIRWFFNDVFYIAMLCLALAGVILRVPVDYWIIMTPIFGLISIIEGWSHFKTRSAKVGLVFKIIAIWAAVLFSIYLFENESVKGVMTINATALTIMVLLALGTFVAGVQAHVWQICAVGGLLFLSVPGVGWLDNSPLLLVAATVVIIFLGGIIWWIEESRSDAA